jgi:membrane fusion protein (multidrug efflux system)
VEKGQYVSPGQALVWLQALDPIWVDFPVPEGSVGKFTIGSTIELLSDAFPGQLFKGEVEAFDAKLGQDTRTLMVRARVPNPDRKLLPGMFANVAVLSSGAKQFVTVPRTAVTYGLYGDSVWVVKEGAPEPAAKPTPVAEAEPIASAIAADAAPTGAIPAKPNLVVERRFVRVGPTEGDRVAILEGVKAGEEVVTSGQLKLQPGAKIKVDNSGALKAPAELPRQ